MCIAGFVLFAGASVLSLVWKESLFALLTALGVVVEIIAGTSLLVYRKSLEQLNYYSSLHNNERFLPLINISSKTGCKDELLTKIVLSELERLKQAKKIKNRQLLISIPFDNIIWICKLIVFERDYW